jgi:helicase MOV-10
MKKKHDYGAGFVSLDGLPKETSSGSLSAFLTDVLEHQPSNVKQGVKLVSIRDHKRSCSALLKIPKGKEVYKRVSALVRQTPFDGKLIRSVRLCDDPQLQVSQPRSSPGEALLANSGSSNQATASRAQRGASKSWEEVKDIAKGFHTCLLGRSDFESGVVDRGLGSEAFQEFYKAYQQNVGDAPVAPDPRLEPCVFTSLRTLGLCRSKRSASSPGHILLLIRNKDGLFPTALESRTALVALKEARDDDAKNKGGVVVSDAVGPCFVETKATQKFEFRVKSSDATVELTGVLVSGQHSRAFTLRALSLPRALSKEVNIELHFTAVRVGVFHATVTLVFQALEDGSKFRISRYLVARTGNKELDRLLAPVTPFEKKRFRVYKDMPDEVYDPPKPLTPNPFLKLGSHRIPREVGEMLISQEFTRSIVIPDECSAAGYGKFWKYLLWAMESQNNVDIQLFDMENVSLTRVGNAMLLSVPGLAEGRPSVLRGDLVHLTWRNRLYRGRVNQVRQLDVALDFHPSFVAKFNPAVDRVDVRFTFSRVTYRTSHEGCVAAESSMGPRLLFPNPGHLLTIGAIAEGSPTNNILWANRNLNEEQQLAVSRVLEGNFRPVPYVVFGPPGTGKTTTVVEAIYQLAIRKRKILLVAPSNDAADVLLKRLSTHFSPSEMRRVLAFSRPLDSMEASIRQYAQEALNAEEQAKAILSAKVVVSTVNLAARFPFFGIPRGYFDVLCVDEAGHSTEPEVIAGAATLVDFSGSGQLILSGDPQQLGPVVTSEVCRLLGMADSYMERLMKRPVYCKDDGGNYHPGIVTKLVRNYRSHPAILKLPNELFYDGDLECSGEVLTTHNLCKWEHLPKQGFPVIFHSMEGDNLRESLSPSWFNPQEAQQVVEYVKLLLLESRPPVQPEDIGIITPYARQAQKIRLALTASLANSNVVDRIKVGSVEVFQGQERRVIILSTVRSEPDKVSTDLRYNLGFVASAKRFNVAVTRAKSLLIVIGCAKVLSMDRANWLPFLQYCRENGSWTGEPWDEVEIQASLDDEAGVDIELDASEDWQNVEAPSLDAAEEAFAFVNREE